MALRALPRTAWRNWRGWRRPGDLRIPLRSTEAEDTGRRFPLYGLLPLWVVPGLADWWMHRRTRIEHTTGTKESAAHALMMTEAGVPVLMGLLARVNPLVLTTLGGAALAHGATALYDVSPAVGEREVRPIVQHIHRFLEVLPLTALSFTACLHTDQVRETLRGGADGQDWRPLPKEHPLPAAYLAGLAGVVVPYAEELRRCLRTASRGGSRR
ncbi:diguanylate cyclase [Streptomyces sp. NPDC048254]|uniref:diguanylate cyclase n=1 Tax=Streptomyces sp. NPDC048254 TaxID=3365525 RepID=UPI00371FFE3A